VDTIEIRSPIAGRVADAYLVPGELVHAHDRIVEVQNLDQLWIRTYVREDEAQRVQPGHDAVVTFPANPNLRLQGKVVRTAPALSAGDRVLPLWIEVANPDSFLREGMLARVTIDAPPVERPVTVRRAAQLN
jgi:multidrug resistance efflux pump